VTSVTMQQVITMTSQAVRNGPIAARRAVEVAATMTKLPVTSRFDPLTLAKVDARRGTVSREVWIERIITAVVKDDPKPPRLAVAPRISRPAISADTLKRQEDLNKASAARRKR
jgi:hypothetical protein